MSTQKETLSQVLADVVGNRKALADQLGTQRQQLEVGEAQLLKFDTLIASLQVSTADEKIMSDIAIQEAANASVSQPGASGASNDAAA